MGEGKRVLLLDDVDGGGEVQSLRDEGVTLSEKVLQLLSQLEEFIILGQEEGLSAGELGLEVEVVGQELLVLEF